MVYSTLISSIKINYTDKVKHWKPVGRNINRKTKGPNTCFPEILEGLDEDASQLSMQVEVNKLEDRHRCLSQSLESASLIMLCYLWYGTQPQFIILHLRYHAISVYLAHSLSLP